MYSELSKKISKAIEDNLDELFELNLSIASEPEIAGEEFKSSKKIVTLLKKHGFEVEYPFLDIDTAFKATPESTKDYKHKVAFLTEYDALPEVGHACGHSLSGSISCLAGIAVKSIENELGIQVDVIGTPEEEVNGAKCRMTDSGVFDDYELAAMVHLYNQNLIKPKLLALRSDLYTFHGKAAHASAAPWEGINAFNAAQLAFHGTDMLRQHVKPDVRIHGIIRNGGAAPNIVPEKVTAEIYVRALKRDYMEAVNEKVVNCVRAGCLATGCTWESEPTAETYADIRPNATGEQSMKEVFEELEIPDNGDYDEIFGSADIGNVSYACPAFHPCLQLTPRDVSIHSREFAEYVTRDEAKKCLLTGAKILAFHVAKIFSDEERIKAMRADCNKA